MQPSLFPLENKKKTELIKHTSAIHIKGNLSLVDRKVLNVLLKNAYNDLEKQRYHTIRLSEIRDCVGWEGKNHVKLKKSLTNLVETKIEWNILGRDKKNIWTISSLLASASITGGKCIYDYPYHLTKLFKNPSIYGRINLIIQNNFKSKYSLILWEFLMDCLGGQNSCRTDWILINQYKNLMSVDSDQYKTFKLFNFYLVKAPIKEINKVSNIKVKVEYQKSANTVVATRFLIEKKSEKDLENQKSEQLSLKEKTKENPPEEGIESIESEEIIKNKLLNFCKLSVASVDQILKYYKSEQLAANIKYIEAENKKGAIKTIAAYSFNAIKNDFRLVGSEDKPKIKEEPEEIKILRKNLKKAFIHNQIDYDIYLNGNNIRKVDDMFLISVLDNGAKLLRTKYSDILDKFKINLEIINND